MKKTEISSHVSFLIFATGGPLRAKISDAEQSGREGSELVKIKLISGRFRCGHRRRGGPDGIEGAKESYTNSQRRITERVGRQQQLTCFIMHE